MTDVLKEWTSGDQSELSETRPFLSFSFQRLGGAVCSDGQFA